MNFFLLRHRPTWTLRLTALLILPMQLITGNQLVYAQATALVQPKPARNELTRQPWPVTVSIKK